MATNTFINCAFNSAKSVLTTASIDVTDTDCQYSLAAPVSPAWNAAAALWHKSIILSGLTVPPSPGNSPYTGYEYDLFGTSRNEIGAAYMATIVNKGDRYIALVTAHGWTEKHVYEWDGTTWLDITPITGMTIFDKGTNQYKRYTGTVWETPLISTSPAEISALPNKCTPLNTDLMIIEDLSDSSKKKNITLGSLVQVLNGYVYPSAHDLAGAAHNADTITNLNLKLSDGDVISTKAGEIAALTNKCTPTTSDLIMIEDAADTNKKKQILISALPAAAPASHSLAGTLHAADTITNLNTKLSDGDVISTKAGEIAALTAKGTPVAADFLMIEDSADTNNKKRITISTLPAATPAAHDLAGTAHNADTLTNLNSKLSDGDVISTKAGEINALTNKATAEYADIILIEDSAGGAWSKKKLPVSGLLEAVRTNFYPADSLMSPVTGWAVNTLAAIVPDATYTATLVRALNDTTEMGFGVQFYIPAGVTNLIIECFGRPATAPATPKTCLMKIYTKNMPLNSAQVAWTAGTAMTSWAIPANAYWQNYVQTISLATLSLTADNMCMIQINRIQGTLVGDFNFAGMKISFS